MSAPLSSQEISSPEFRRKLLGSGISVVRLTALCNMAQSAQALLHAVQIAYTILADIRHDWPDRHTREGQAALCDMRDAICTATGRDPEDVQDEYANTSLIK